MNVFLVIIIVIARNVNYDTQILRFFRFFSVAIDYFNEEKGKKGDERARCIIAKKRIKSRIARKTIAPRLGKGRATDLRKKIVSATSSLIRSLST